MSPISPDKLIAFAIFALVASATPGPNNAMLMASGANFGFRRTIPHMAGVALGFGLMVVLVGVGLGAVFTAYPILQDILWYAGAAYLLWLAWKIGTATSIGASNTPRPMRFLEICAFQWVNPKAWIGAVVAITQYAPREHYFSGLAMISVVFLMINVPVVVAWSGFGVGVRRFLERPGALRIFNILMALALAGSLVPEAVERLGWHGR